MGRTIMLRKFLAIIAVSLACVTFTATAAAQTWSPEQQEVWQLELQQWKMAAAKDMSWIDTMVHPNMRFWETGDPMPRDKASLKHWSRYDIENSTMLQHELFPIAVTVTGNVAVVQYHYREARENFKKERETVIGQYTDVLIKENGRWMFITWTGGVIKTD
jgi:Domain of unknown function (DUF4440)